MTNTSQDIIDMLYINMKELFIGPATVTKCINILTPRWERTQFHTKREEMVIVHGSTMTVKRYGKNVCP